MFGPQETVKVWAPRSYWQLYNETLICGQMANEMVTNCQHQRSGSDLPKVRS